MHKNLNSIFRILTMVGPVNQHILFLPEWMVCNYLSRWAPLPVHLNCNSNIMKLINKSSYSNRLNQNKERHQWKTGRGNHPMNQIYRHHFKSKKWKRKQFMNQISQWDASSVNASQRRPKMFNATKWPKFSMNCLTIFKFSPNYKNKFLGTHLNKKFHFLNNSACAANFPKKIKNSNYPRHLKLIWGKDHNRFDRRF